MKILNKLYIFLFYKLVWTQIYVDTSKTVNGDGSLLFPFNTLLNGLISSNLTNNQNLIIKEFVIQELLSNIYLTKNLKIWNDDKIKKGRIFIKNNFKIIITAKITFENVIFFRDDINLVESFYLKNNAFLTFENCTFSFYSNQNYSNFIFSDQSNLFFSNIYINSLNNSNFSSFINGTQSTFSFKNINFYTSFKSSFISAIDSIIDLDNFLCLNCNIEKNTFFDLIYNENIMIISNNFKNLVFNFSNQNIKSESTSFLLSSMGINSNISYNAGFLFENLQINDCISYSPFISIQRSKAQITFRNSKFVYNTGGTMIYAINNYYLTLNNVNCLRKNEINSLGISNLSPCFEIRNVYLSSFNLVNVENCFGSSVAGFLLTDDSNILTQFNFNSILPSADFTACSFLNNIVFYEDNSNNEIGTSIYAATSKFMNFTSCIFKNNILNTTEDFLKVGGACINSIDFFQKINIFSSNFISNSARYYSNCIIFSGSLLVIDSSLFKDNVPILSSDNLNNRENLGGALYILAEFTRLIKNSFINNFNYNGGAMYINGNKNRANANLFQYQNVWINNSAIYYGGAIFFDYDFIILESNITGDTFKWNWAEESGGAIFTQFSSSDAKINLYTTLFQENLAGIGGALGMTHLLGSVLAYSCQFLKNVASYMKISDFLQNKQPSPSDRGSGGALRLEGRIFSLFNSTMSLFQENWAALRGGVITGLPGNSTFLKSILKGNHAIIGGTGYVGTFHFIYLLYTSITGDYSHQTGTSLVVKEFCLLQIVASVFQNCYTSQSQGVVTISDDIITIIMYAQFINISAQEGSIMYVSDIKNAIFMFVGVTVLNSYGFYSLISFYDCAAVSITSANFTNNKGRIFLFKNTEIVISGSFFKNNDCTFQIDIEACLLYLSDSSSVVFTTSSIYNISNIKEGGSIYVLDSILSVNGLKINFTKSSEMGACIRSDYSNLNIKDSVFSNYEKGCLYFVNTNATVINNNFSNEFVVGQKSSSSSSFICLNCLNVNIENCIFSKNINNAENGGVNFFNYYKILKKALYFSNDVTNFNCRLTVKKSKFSQNTGCLKGGAIYFEFQNAIFIENIFNDNEAVQGGALYYYEYLFHEYRNISFINNNFINNIASIEGGAIKYIEKRPLNLSSNIFQGNKAKYGNDFASYPIRLRLMINESIYPNNSTFKLEEEVSNHMISKNLKFGLFDIDHQECILINTGQGFLAASEQSSPMNSSIDISGSLTQFIANGEFQFENILIKSYPAKKKFNLTVTTTEAMTYYPSFLKNLSENEYNISGRYSIIIPVDLRECTTGEIYEKIYEGCYECEYSKYSFDPKDEICNACPDNAICYGGNNISLLAGYWRSSNTSTNLIKCSPYPDSCLGGFHSTCQIGYVGPLCQTCDIYGDKIYRKSGLFECSECGSATANIVLIVFVVIMIFFFYIMLLKANISKLKQIQIDPETKRLTEKSKKDMHLSILFRIFLNYLQIVSLAQDFDLSWPEAIQNVFAIQYNLGNISEYMFSFDCFIKDSASQMPTLYMKALLTGISPVIAIVFILAFWICYYLKKKVNVKNDLITTLLISTYFLQPSIISMMAKIMSCKELDPGRFFITTSLYYECYTDQHNKYIFLMALPLLLLWVGIYPISLLIYLIINRKNLDYLELRKKVGFIYNGYHSNYFYWEFVIMLRKIAIILIAAFLKYNPFARALIVLLILGVAIYVQTIKKPYFSNILNEMEYRAIIVSLFTIYFGLYYYVTPDDYAQVITIVVILTSNIYFLYYWLMHMIISNYEYVVHLLRHIPPLQRFVIGIKSKYDAFTRILSSKRVKTTRNMKSSNSIRSVNEMLDSKLDSSTNKISIDTSKKIFPKAKKNNKE